MTPQRPRRRMTSKSPDTQDDGSAAAPSRSAGAGDSEQSETLTQLREAISEIDQRHAEGESGFFTGLSAPGGSVESTADGWSEGRAGSAPDFADALSFADGGSDDAEDGADFDADYAKAKKTAMNMLAMRDHSREELRKKLLKRDLMSEAVDELLVVEQAGVLELDDEFENSRLLNDEEFAHRFVRA